MKNRIFIALVLFSVGSTQLLAGSARTFPWVGSITGHRTDASRWDRRSYVFAIRQTAPPVASSPVPLAFSAEAADTSDSFNRDTGCFTAQRDGYYRITAQVTFPATASPAMVPGACSLFVETSASSQRPAVRRMRTGQYRRRLPCSANIETSEALSAGQMACIRVSTSASSLSFAGDTMDPQKFVYLFSFLTILEER